MMSRTQLYFEKNTLEYLTDLSTQKKTTIAALVRKAVAKVYGSQLSKKARLKALRSACGIWKNRTDLPPTDQYIRSLRKDTRAQRLGLPIA